MSRVERLVYIEEMIKEPKIHTLRILRSRSIPYITHQYPAKLSNAQEVARYLGIPEEHLYKTLVSCSLTHHRPMLALIPSNKTLNLKTLALVSDQKRVRLVTYKEAEKLTGLRVGGISALAFLHKQWPVYLDASAQSLDTLVMNAGKRGVQVEIGRKDFILLVSAKVASLT